MRHQLEFLDELARRRPGAEARVRIVGRGFDRKLVADELLTKVI